MLPRKKKKKKKKKTCGSTGADVFSQLDDAVLSLLGLARPGWPRLEGYEQPSLDTEQNPLFFQVSQVELINTVLFEGFCFSSYFFSSVCWVSCDPFFFYSGEISAPIMSDLKFLEPESYAEQESGDSSRVTWVLSILRDFGQG